MMTTSKIAMEEKAGESTMFDLSPSVKGPLFKWFGSKWLASKHYPNPIGTKIIEPFAGGAGYSLRHAPCNVHIAESDKNLQALWKWLLSADAKDVLEIPCHNAIGADIRSMSINYGQQLLLKNWQRTNNVSDCWTISPWGNLPGQWTEKTRARVAADVEKIKHWKFSDDAFSLLSSPLAFDTEITWFIDPPYFYNYRYRDGSSFDYKRLRECIGQLKGQVIVCEAICSKTGKRPNWLSFDDFRHCITSRRKAGNNTHSKELIYHRLPAESQ